MIVVIEINLKKVKFWCYHQEKLQKYKSYSPEEIEKSGELFFDNAANTLIAIKTIMFNPDINPHTICNNYKDFYTNLKEYYPAYYLVFEKVVDYLRAKHEAIPLQVFSDTVFFNNLPHEEGAYAIPHSLSKKYNLKKVGMHGIIHQYNASLFKTDQKIISVVLDYSSTICAMYEYNPYLISAGYSGLEGVMTRTSCGDIDPGIAFYLMKEKNYSIYQVDSLLKNNSGFFGLTGYDADFEELLRLRSESEKVSFSIEIYKNQILKYIGESIAKLNGVDVIVFSGQNVKCLQAIIYDILKELSCFGLNLKMLPWNDKNENNYISSKESKISACINYVDTSKVICKFMSKSESLLCR